MHIQPSAPPSAPETQPQPPSPGAWWRQAGEPVLLTGLVGLAGTLPLLLVLGLLSLAQAHRAMLVVIWLVALLLLTRLPRWLRQEQRRVLVISMLGGIAILFMLVVSHSVPTHAEAMPTTLEEMLLLDTRVNPPVAPAHAVTLNAPHLLAPLPQGREPLTFKAPPRISRQQFVQLLERGRGGAGPSPAAPFGNDLYDIIVGYELDPAVALAFFAMESQFCTTGICHSHDMKSWGAQRAAFNPQRSAGIVRGRSGPFVSYHNWHDGVRDWCELIVHRYVARGLETIELAIPVYAPASDGNVPMMYIDNIHRLVALWQGHDPGTIASSNERRYEDLITGLLMETFLATGQAYHANWAFHAYALTEARAGRSLGSPLADSRYMTAGNHRYVVQAFTHDTLYTPLADIESQTNWSDVRRLSHLVEQIRQTQPGPPVPADPGAPATP